MGAPSGHPNGFPPAIPQAENTGADPGAIQGLCKSHGATSSSTLAKVLRESSIVGSPINQTHVLYIS